MSQLPAFRQLQNFIGEKTARKPKISRSKPKPETANETTRRIVKHVRANGGYATRLNSTGTFRVDLNKFVPSQQVSGLPDVLAIIEGRAVFVEVKAGSDRLSEVQKQTINNLQNAGARVFVAHSFDEFLHWFADLAVVNSNELPFGSSPVNNEQ